MMEDVVLLVFINVVWLLQISLPLLDDHTPSLFSVPLSELACVPVAVLLVILTRSLLRKQSRCKQISRGRKKEQKSNCSENDGAEESWWFLTFASLWVAGVGVHVCAVTVELQLAAPEDRLYPVVHDHMHRFWAHSTFQSGYYGLILLVAWNRTRREERKGFMSCLLLALWSLMMGAAYAIVAQATETILLTISFYAAVVCIMVTGIANPGHLNYFSLTFLFIGLSVISGIIVNSCQFIATFIYHPIE